MPVEVCRSGHPAAGQSGGGGPPGEGFDECLAAVRVAGQETRQHGIAGTHAAAGRHLRRLSDKDSIGVGQDGALGAQTGQHRSGAPAAQHTGRGTHVFYRGEIGPYRLGQFLAVGFERGGAGFGGGAKLGAAGVDGQPDS